MKYIDVFLKRYEECFNDNKMNKIEFVKGCINKWCIPKDVKDRGNMGLDKLYESLETLDFSPLIKAFRNRLNDINYNFSKSEQVSGAVCFFGGIFTSVSYYGNVKNIEELFTFALCYMLVDHYLDNSNICFKEKKDSITQFLNFLDGNKQNSENIILEAGKDRYVSMIEKIPHVENSIKELFHSEIESFKIECGGDFKREDYFKCACDKGGKTALTIAKIIEMENRNDLYEAYELGAAIQFVDDLIDLEDDKKENIHTWAIYELEKGSYLDYIYICCKIVSNIDKKYNFFKIILFHGLVLGMNDLKIIGDFQIENYNIFEGITKYYLIDWFHKKLYDYVDEHNL